MGFYWSLLIKKNYGFNINNVSSWLISYEILTLLRIWDYLSTNFGWMKRLNDGSTLGLGEVEIFEEKNYYFFKKNLILAYFNPVCRVDTFITMVFRLESTLFF